MTIASRLAVAMLCVAFIPAGRAPAQAPTRSGPRLQIIAEPASKIEPTRVVCYKKVGDRELQLHLFEPAGHKPSDRRSCFVVIHGGGWTSGEPRRMYTYGEHFAKLGMVVASLQYRLVQKAQPGVTPFECVKDGRSAVRYLKSHAAELGIDPNKIAVGGGSAGGHVAVGTALFDGIDDETDDLSISPTPAALVLFYPVIDTSMEGYGHGKCGPRWKEISPVDHVRPGLPPTITFFGTGDTVTPFVGAKRFDELMREAGNRSELVIHEGGVHGYFLYDWKLYDEAVARTEQFLKSVGLLDDASTRADVPRG